MVFLLYFINMLNTFSDFQIMNQVYTPQINYIWSLCTILSICCYCIFFKRFVKVLVIMFTKSIDLYFGIL